MTERAHQEGLDETPRRCPNALNGILADCAEVEFQMSCEDRSGSLLATLAASKPGGRFLELGTGAGAGAAWLLDGMDDDATLLSIDQSAEVQAIAQKHLGKDSRARFEVHCADEWLTHYEGEPFDFAFVDCRPGKFNRLSELLAHMRIGGLYVGDDLLPQPTWPDDHQQRVDSFVANLPNIATLKSTVLAWSSGLVIGVKVKD